MFDNTTSDSNSSPTIIFEMQLGKSSLKCNFANQLKNARTVFLNSEICATYDEVKLAAKRGGLVYVTPEHTFLQRTNVCVIPHILGYLRKASNY